MYLFHATVFHTDSGIEIYNRYETTCIKNLQIQHPAQFLELFPDLNLFSSRSGFQPFILGLILGLILILLLGLCLLHSFSFSLLISLGFGFVITSR